MRYLILAELLLALARTGTAAEPPVAFEDGPPAAVVAFSATTDPARFTVFVHRDTGGGGGEAGTGTIVACEDGRSLVLTNAHVAAVDAAYTVTHAGRVHAARYLAGSPVDRLGPALIDVRGPDLAVLVVDAELPAAPVADEAPARGERVRLWGFGGRLGVEGALEKVGRAVGLARFTVPTFSYTARTISGDSGSGVFNDRGELVAVHHGCENDGSVAYGVPLAQVRQFLRTHAGRLFPRLSARLAGRFDDPPEAFASAPPPAVQRPAPPPAKKVLSYAELIAEVKKGKRMVLYVGFINAPIENADGVTASLPGIKDGVYVCFLQGGVPVMQACADGKCPLKK